MTLRVTNDGRLAETFLSNARIPVFGRHVYAYDTHGRLVKRTSYNPDGSAVLEDIYFYNPTGNLLKKHTQNAKSRVVIGSKQEFRYQGADIYSEYSDGKFVREVQVTRDDQCRIIKSLLLKNDGKLENTLTMKFDDHGNLVEQIVESPTGKEIEKSKYEYDYDNRLNWIKKRFFEWHYWDQTDKYMLTSEETRSITYIEPR